MSDGLTNHVDLPQEIYTSILLYFYFIIMVFEVQRVGEEGKRAAVF
jgi:hypothetical protein